MTDDRRPPNELYRRYEHNGKLVIYAVNGEIRRKIIDETGTIRHFAHIEGRWVYHREDGPAIYCEPSNGSTKRYECWYKNGHLHRLGGPATTEWRSQWLPPSYTEPNPKATFIEQYFVNGKIHDKAEFEFWYPAKFYG